jgi:hypothetical protein
MKLKWGTVVVATLLAAQTVHAQDSAAALNAVTAQDLLKLLVDEGVIDKEKLKVLADKIQNRQNAQPVSGAVETVGAENKDKKPVTEGNVVRVPYVPQYIKDEIRDQVRIGLKEDVSRDVLAQAKTERWGMPGVLPDWVERIKFYGDVRLRGESTFYGNENAEFDYLDVAALNKGVLYSATEENTLNTTEDRHRLRARMRLGMKAKVFDRLEAGARLVTGSQGDPVSTNQTLGTGEQKWQTTFDLAYLKYNSRDKSIQAAGGRIENPFYNTDLVWDNDLTFEGIAATWWPLRSDDMDADFRSIDPFVRAGVFPLQEIERSNQDKWLYGAQTGFQYDWANQNKLTLALAYYAYENIAGRKNEAGLTTYNYTALQTWQKGNVLYDIHTDAADTIIDSEKRLYGHAADYKLADLFVEYDIANFAPLHVILTADYVKNIGYDKKAVEKRLGLDPDAPLEYEARTEGYQFKAALGWPVISKARDWQVAFIYRYLERDAVLAEFTDSDFHGGGTDAKGYTLKFDYGIADNTWMTLRWMSSDEIDGSGYPDYNAFGTGKLGIDTLQLDLNAKF